MLRRARTMPARFARLGRTLALGAGLATARFPVAALLVVAFAAVSNLEIAELDWGLPPELSRLLSALGGAAAASVGMRLGVEARARPGSPSLLVLPMAAAATVGALLWFGEPLSLFAPAILPAAVLSIFLAPFVGRGTPRQFWTFTLWAGVGVTLAFMSVILFVLGLLAILEMIRFLFDIGPGGRAYEHIFVTALTLVGPLFALGRIPRLDGDELTFRSDDRLVAAVRPLFDWVAAPLSLLTSAVLHLYAGRIAVTGEMPVGEVGWIVTFFSILVLSVRIAIDPFLQGAAAPARLFGRIWAWMLVVPLALLAVAAWLRIAPEGYTVERYYLVLGGLAAALVVLAQAVPRLRGDIRLIAAVPVCLLVLSVVGPWGVADVVGRSQVSLIRRDFVDRTASNPKLRLADLTERERYRLRSRVIALGEVGQLRRIAALVPDDRREAALAALARPEDERTRAYAAALGLSRAFEEGGSRSFSAIPGRPIRIDSFDAAIFGLGVAAGEAADRSSDRDVALRFDGMDLVVAAGGTTERFDLAAALASLPPALFEGRQEVEPPVLDLSSAGGRTIRVRLEWLQLDAAGAPVNATLAILFRSSEWPDGSFGGG